MPNKEEIKKADPIKEERDKHNALLAGVIFFMLLIIILWVMNLGMVFRRAPVKTGDQLEIDRFSRDFQKAFAAAGAKMGDLKKIDAAELQKYAARFSATTSAATSTIKK
ncbi:MAG TPA: hypothetical protein VMC41_00120 [Candidatus Nanoarchaeia archaeon]|nr:hypothetical protein [Candidatus Nanoarchaeia archaeon]